jgi:hypothetical protein
MNSPKYIAQKNNQIGLCILAGSYKADISKKAPHSKTFEALLFCGLNHTWHSRTCSRVKRSVPDLGHNINWWDTMNFNQWTGIPPRVKLIQTGQGGSCQCGDKVAQNFLGGLLLDRHSPILGICQQRAVATNPLPCITII